MTLTLLLLATCFHSSEGGWWRRSSCSKVNCKWSAWSSWGSCNYVCRSGSFADRFICIQMFKRFQFSSKGLRQDFASIHEARGGLLLELRILAFVCDSLPKNMHCYCHYRCMLCRCCCCWCRCCCCRCCWWCYCLHHRRILFMNVYFGVVVILVVVFIGLLYVLMQLFVSLLL